MTVSKSPDFPNDLTENSKNDGSEPSDHADAANRESGGDRSDDGGQSEIRTSDNTTPFPRPARFPANDTPSVNDAHTDGRRDDDEDDTEVNARALDRDTDSDERTTLADETDGKAEDTKDSSRNEEATATTASGGSQTATPSPAPQPASSTKPPQGQDSGTSPLVVIMAAIIGAVLAVMLMRAMGPGGNTDAVEADIDALRNRVDSIALGNTDPSVAAGIRQEITALRSRITDLEALRREVARIGTGTAASSTPAAATGTGVAALEGNITELSDAVRQVETRVAQLSGEVTQGQARMQTRLDTLEGLTPPDLPERLSLLARQTDLTTLADRVGSLERNDVAQDARRAALAVSLANLTRASQSSAPFNAELQAMGILVKDDATVAELQPYAERGLPSVESLAGTFDGVARETIRAHYVASDAGILERLWANIVASISVRPQGEVEGDTTPAIVARAERRLDENNLLAAVQELVKLSGEPQGAITPWLTDAKARLDLDRLIARLNTRVIETIAIDTATAE